MHFHKREKKNLQIIWSHMIREIPSRCKNKSFITATKYVTVWENIFPMDLFSVFHISVSLMISFHWSSSMRYCMHVWCYQCVLQHPIHLKFNTVTLKIHANLDFTFLAFTFSLTQHECLLALPKVASVEHGIVLYCIHLFWQNWYSSHQYNLHNCTHKFIWPTILFLTYYITR